MQRNKALVAIAAICVLCLIGGITGTSLALLRANAEWQRAEGNARQAEREREIAQRQEQHAIKQQKLAEASELEAREVVRDFYISHRRELTLQYEFASNRCVWNSSKRR